MKNLLTFTFVLFSVVCSLAQDLLLSEDFNYPVGTNLNQYNWKPLTSAADNPIKVTQGLTQPNFSASGGAAYLNKNGQDVVRSFMPITEDKLTLSFQFTYKDMQKTRTYGGVSCNLYAAGMNISSSNYFMFLSSKEEPNKPLIKFSLYASWCAGGANYLIVRDSQEKIIAGILLDFNELFTWSAENKEVIDITFEYNLRGTQAGKAVISSTSKVLDILTPYSGGIIVSQIMVNNIANIALSQSDLHLGSKVIIDRIRLSKSRTIVQMKDAGDISLNATVFPNTTDGRLDLLINDKTPKGEFDMQLADNQGNSLFQGNGDWESMKPKIEQILSKSNTGQYFLSIKQGNESKTIRVFRQE